MAYSIEQIASLLNCKPTIVCNSDIEYLVIDSRKISVPNEALFFALKTERRDGHNFIEEVYHRGVRNFVVEENFNINKFPLANFLVVKDVLQSLQQIASKHRAQFTYPVIGITGSNGKTIVKEWLFQLLHENFNIVRSPRSYNSQIGVPLSVWQMKATNNLAIFEAGISTVHEMEKLEQIIQPTIGILTNIGNAHNDGFESEEQKILEKIKLFQSAEILISNSENEKVDSILKNKYLGKLLVWGKNKTDDLYIVEERKGSQKTQSTLKYKEKEFQLSIPFTDEASLHNAYTCCLCMLVLNLSIKDIQEKIAQLHAVDMRMQLLKIPNNCTLINDSYSNDISSFYIALDYLNANADKHKKTLILSDFTGVEKNKTEVYNIFFEHLKNSNINRVIGIGKEITSFGDVFQKINIETNFFKNTDEFLNNFTSNHFKNEYILLKGARVFNFEKISLWLQQKTHQTVMEINLTALVHNLKEYQKYLEPTTKTMAMVKAFSYGSGSAEIAKVLQFNKVDYLGVAYTDEGVELRKAGISLPILVLNIDEEGFDDLVEFNLEPEIFSTSIYHQFNNYLNSQAIEGFPVHIKLNTGMNRLGFDEHEIDELCSSIINNKTMMVKSVMSHLAASEDENEDFFTNNQLQHFEKFCSSIKEKIGYDFIKHIANSAAIFRNKKSQYDMVRLGIGLYGVDSSKNHQLQLQTVSTLKTTIAQIRKVKATETIGYNRNGKLQQDSVIATVRMGYADGLMRCLGNKKGSMFLHGKLAPIIGNVCMDMTMLDVTHIPEAKENDVVEVFGKNLPVQQLAEWSNTIAYETLSTINQRVRRIYIEE
jgi:Alr-MurF fusion protein